MRRKLFPHITSLSTENFFDLFDLVVRRYNIRNFEFLGF